MWFWSRKCRSNARVDNKVIIITGANSGIGQETALELVRRGGTVVMANRNVESSEAALKEIRAKLEEESHQLDFPSETNKFGTIDFVQLDLASLESVRKCGYNLLQKYPHIDILINNAGIMACQRAVSKDGIELQMATNHIGHFLLTCILLPRIIQSKPARIINVSSLAHIGGRIDFDDFNSEKYYSPSFNYANSKLANILFTRELDKRLKERDITEVTTYALHPGVVATGLGRHLSAGLIFGATFIWYNIVSLFIKTPKQGAQTTLHCALDEQAGTESGLYYSDCEKTMPIKTARDEKAAEQLWEKSVELTKMDWDPFNPNSDPTDFISLN